MTVGRFSRIVALDGGTTNTRARLVVNCQVVFTARRAVGVRDNVLAQGNPLAASVRACLDEAAAACGSPIDRVVAAGMLSSEVGLVGVPHVIAPAGLSELANASVDVVLPDIHPGPILVIPGIKTPSAKGEAGWAMSDLMRGEEVETFGAMEALGIVGKRMTFLWPGSHTKLIEIDESGRIMRSFTTLAGEIAAALAGHTLIAKSLPREFPDQPDLEAARLGARLCREHGLGRAAFLVRIADVVGALDEQQRAAFLVGAVVAEDACRIAGHPIVKSGCPLLVGGRDPQRSLYRELLTDLIANPVEAMGEEIGTTASALGAVAVANARH